jgi:UDP-glucose 4-epimerase
MSGPVWVIGAGGMLGSAVCRELGVDAWTPRRSLTWRDEALLAAELQEAVSAFVAELALRRASFWAIAWCAGAGVVGTSATALEAETRTFQLFLRLLAAEPTLTAMRGHVLLASSAGGVYGGSLRCPITEDTPPEPISAYGRTKLAQEQTLVAWATRLGSVATLAARLSNIYGPAQRLDKPQGLISHMSRCLIHNAPVHVYVSLDTIRDYLFSEDAGRRLAVGLRRLVRESSIEARHVTKVYGSEREISIAGLLGIFRQFARRSLRVVSGLSSVGALQPRRLQFRSRVWVEDADRQVELVEGISRVYKQQLVRFRQGQLPPPPLV